MTDRLVESRIKILMRGRDDDDTAALVQSCSSALEFAAIILNMLQNIDVENRVEAFRGIDVFKFSDPHFADRRQMSRADFGAHSPSERGVRLQRDPLRLAFAESPCGCSESSADLKNPRTDMPLDARRPIGFPVGR